MCGSLGVTFVLLSFVMLASSAFHTQPGELYNSYVHTYDHSYLSQCLRAFFACDHVSCMRTVPGGEGEAPGDGNVIAFTEPASGRLCAQTFDLAGRNTSGLSCQTATDLDIFVPSSAIDTQQGIYYLASFTGNYVPALLLFDARSARFISELDLVRT